MHTTHRANVKRGETDEMMVLEVTLVMESERLKVYCAMNQKGVACSTAHGKSGAPEKREGLRLNT